MSLKFFLSRTLGTLGNVQILHLKKKKIQYWDFPSGPVADTPNAGGTGLIPGQGTKIPHAASKSLHVATKTQLSQIN